MLRDSGRKVLSQAVGVVSVLVLCCTACKGSGGGGSGGSGGEGATGTGGYGGYGGGGAGGGGAGGIGPGGQGGEAGASGGCSVAGTWSCTVTQLEDPAGHDPYIGKPFANPITCTGGGSAMSCTGTAPFVDVAGSLGTDCAFDLSGSGTVAGYSNVSCKMTGSGAGGKLAGKYVMGAAAELPQGQSMTAHFTCTKQ